jgi:exodeoxyribonuclease V alpha subunit
VKNAQKSTQPPSWVVEWPAGGVHEPHFGLSRRPTDQLIPLAERLLEAPKQLILTALELERSDGAVIADKVGGTACIFLAGLYRAEQAIADRLTREC